MNKAIEIQPGRVTEELEQALHILHNLRFFTKYWNENGGGQARQYKKYWEEKADNLLNTHGLTLHQNTRSITIIKTQP